VHIKLVAGSVSDPDVRTKLISWEQDTCKDLAQPFKEMVVSRATIARLAGFKSYFHYRSQSHMMTTGSVERFLNDLKSWLSHAQSAFIERIFEQKVKDLNPDFSIKELRHRLKYYGNTVCEFQNAHPATQINSGDLACTYILGVLFHFLNRTRCCTIKCLPS
jgi:Zn-dependent oligopeptidase